MIWKLSIEGLLQSDLAIKLKAERPHDTSLNTVRESQQLLATLPIEACVKARSPEVLD